jgi:DNA-binding transcriptional LysR family regulator
METNRLRQFCVVYETGNLRKAADLLAISHSGLSKSMKMLQMEVGFPLFHASGRGIVISDEGNRLYKHAKAILAQVESLLGAEVQESKILRIGSFEVFTTYFMGPLLHEYLSGREVEIHELVPGRLEEALLFNKIDLGITYEPVPRKGIEYVKVTSLLMGAFALRGSFKDMKLDQIPFIVPVTPLEGAPSGVKGRDAWPDEKIERNIRYRVDLLGTGLEIARRGLGAVFIPNFLAKLHNDSVIPSLRLDAINLPRNIGSVVRDIYIVKRESTGEDLSIRQVAKALRNICSKH